MAEDDLGEQRSACNLGWLDLEEWGVDCVCVRVI